MAADSRFRLVVEDVFSIRGRGTIVTGLVEQGSLEVGDEVKLSGSDHTRAVVVVGIEIHMKRVDRAEEGDYVGLRLQDVGKDEVQRDDVLSGKGWDFDSRQW